MNEIDEIYNMIEKLKEQMKHIGEDSRNILLTWFTAHERQHENRIELEKEISCVRAVLERLLRLMDEGLFVDYQMEKYGRIGYEVLPEMDVDLNEIDPSLNKIAVDEPEKDINTVKEFEIFMKRHKKPNVLVVDCDNNECIHNKNDHCTKKRISLIGNEFMGKSSYFLCASDEYSTHGTIYEEEIKTT